MEAVNAFSDLSEFEPDRPDPAKVPSKAAVAAIAKSGGFTIDAAPRKRVKLGYNKPRQESETRTIRIRPCDWDRFAQWCQDRASAGDKGI